MAAVCEEIEKRLLLSSAALDLGDSMAALGLNITGATIVTHGFVGDDGGGDAMLPLAQAIQARAGGWLLDFDAPDMLAEGVFDPEDSLLPGSGDAGHSGEVVLLFDWAPSSDEITPGWAEAAGDALFTMLVELRLVDPAAGAANTIPLHFIGHGTGAVVTSEAVERLAAFQAPVDQVTYLDPQDFEQTLAYGGAQEYDRLAAPEGYGAAVWSNVAFADVYYQTHGQNGWIMNDLITVPQGRPIPGAYNFYLSEENYLPSGTYDGFDALGDDRFTWQGFYLATISNIAPESNTSIKHTPAPANAIPYDQIGYAFSRIKNTAARPAPVFFQYPDQGAWTASTLYRENDLVEDGGTTYRAVRTHTALAAARPAGNPYWVANAPSPQQDHRYSSSLLVEELADGTSTGRPNNAGMARLHLDADEATSFRAVPKWKPLDIVSGDFADVGRAVSTTTPVMPGWSGYGGSAAGLLDTSGDTPVLVLDWLAPAESHNRVYVPAEARMLSFRLRTFTADSDDVLRAVVGTTTVGEWALTALGDQVVTAAIPAALANSVQSLSFSIIAGGGSVGAVVGIDDVKMTGYWSEALAGDVTLVDLKAAGGGSAFTMPSATITDGQIILADDFATSGRFYVLPTIGGDAADIALTNFPAPLSITVDGQPATFQVRFAEGYSTSGENSVALGDTVGAGGTNDSLDVFRVQQRLRYFNFPGRTANEGGNPPQITVDGTNDTTVEEAIALFQASVAADGGGIPYTFVKSGTTYSATSDSHVDPGGSTEAWLNSPIAPFWMRLREPLRGGDMGNEQWGTSWAVQVIEDAVWMRPELMRDTSASGGELFGANAMTEYPDFPTAAPTHSEHKSGLDIDWELDQNRSRSDADALAAGVNYAAPFDINQAAITDFERDIILDLLAFHDAAGALFGKAFVGGSANAGQRTYPVIRDALTTGYGITGTEGGISPVSGHHNHTHVSLRPPTYRTSLPEEVQTAILDTLAQISIGVGLNLLDHDLLTTPITVTGTPIGQTLDLQTILDEALYVPVSEYFNGAATTGGLQTLLDGRTIQFGDTRVRLSSATVSVQSDSRYRDHRLSIDVEVDAWQNTFDVENVYAGAPVQAEEPVKVDWVNKLHLPLHIEMPLQSAAIPAADILIGAADAAITSQILEAGLFSGQYGMTDAEIYDDPTEMDVQLDIGFSGGTVSLEQLRRSDASSLLEVSASRANFAATLPVSTALCNILNGAPGFFANLTDVFSQDLDWSLLPDLESLSFFNNLTPSDVLSMLDQLATTLDSVETQLDIDIPYVQETISDIVDVGGIILDLADQLRGDDGLKFLSFQSLVDALAVELGIDPDSFDLRCDDTTESVLLDLRFSTNVEQSLPLDFAKDLAPLTVSALADVQVSATVDFDLTLGFDMRARSDADTLSDRFFLAEGSTITVSAQLAADPLDVSAAIATIGLCIDEGSLAFDIETQITATDPGTGDADDARVYLSEFIENPVTSTMVASSPVVTVSGHLPVVGCAADINTLLGIDPADPPALDLSLVVPNDISSLTITPNDRFDELLSGFSGFSEQSIYDSIRQIVDFLSDSDLEALNATIPILNVSVNELMDLTDSILDAAELILVDPEQVKSDVEGVLGGLDDAIDAAAAQIDADAQDKLFHLREAISAALAQADLSNLSTDLTSIVEGFRHLIDDLSATIDVTALTDAVDGIDAAVTGVNELEARIETAFGIDPADFSLEFVDLIADPAIYEQGLIGRLTLDQNYSGTVDLGFEFEDGGTAIPVTLESSGAVDVSITGTVQVDFGVDLSDAVPAPFMVSTTSAALNFGLDTSGLVLSAEIGGVGASLGDASDPVVVAVKELKSQSFTQTTAGNRTFTLSPAISSADLARLAVVYVNGVAQGDDAVTVGTGSITFATAPANGASIEILYPGSGDGAINITLNDPSPDAVGRIGFDELAANFGTAVDLGALDAMLGVRAPVYLVGLGIGDFRAFLNLADFSSLYLEFPTDLSLQLEASICDPTAVISGMDVFLGVLQTGMESDLLGALPLIGDSVNAGGSIVGELRDLLEDMEDVIDGAAADIQQFLFDNLGPGSGLGLDVLYFDDGGTTARVTDPSQIDVTVGGPECITINLHLIGTDTLASVPFDLGLDALDFDFSGALEVELGYDMELGIGLNHTDGFYLQLNTDTADPEIELTLSAGVTGTNLSADLFFLHLSATEGDTMDGGDPVITGLSGTLDVNLTEPSGDGKLTLAEITGNSLPDIGTIDADVTASVDLRLEANINDDPRFPSIGATLLVQWPITGDPADGGSQPQVSITDAELDLGDWLSGALYPTLSRINSIIEPIRPVIDFLNAEIPLISDVSEFLNGHSVTFATIIEGFGRGGATIPDFIGDLNAIDGIVSAIDSLGTSPDVKIDFGAFDFVQDLRTAGTVDVATSGSVDGPTTSPEDQASSAGSGLGEIVNDMTDLGIDLPLLTNPTSLFGLMFGQRVDLVTWDIPPLSASFEMEQLYGPLFPIAPLFARIFGSLSATVDVGIGFDTRGLEQGADFIDGFYFRDLKDGDDAHELELSATIGAGAELNIVVAEAGVEGGLEGTLFADFNDLDDDGKVYLDELDLALEQGPDCVFDLGGTLDAFFNAYVKVGAETIFGDIELVDKKINLLDKTIFRFTHECPPIEPPVLAHRSDGSDGFDEGTLVVHAGAYASQRQSGAVDDVETVDVDLDSTGLVEVSAFGLRQSYDNITAIYINAGDYDDTITISSDVALPVTLIGGDGNDQLEGGSGDDSIDGGEGEDWLIGGAGSDTLKGEDGEDVIFGGDGDDASLDGGDGDDELYGEVGDDTLYGGEGDDVLYSDAQPDQFAEDDLVILGNDQLWGGDGDDQLYGGDGNDEYHGQDGDDTLEDTDGDDTVYADAGDDSITATDGADLIYAGEGNDEVHSGEGDDTVYGEAGSDYVESDTGDDLLIGGVDSDALVGGDGEDTLLGGWGDDILRGDAGADYIEGGPDDDDICGQADADTIYGGTTVYGYPYLDAEPTAVGGGLFWEIDCDSPIFYSPLPLPMNLGVGPGGATGGSGSGGSEAGGNGTGVTRTGQISGQKFEDLNGNGAQDAGEPGLAGWTIELYSIENLLVSSVKTDASGNYSFAEVAPGDYKIAEIVKQGWVQSTPSGAADAGLHRPVYLVSIDAGTILEEMDFGNYRPGTIGGRKFLDANADGLHSANEPYLNGWTIQLYDQDNNPLATQVTHDVDIDGNNQIDISTERGWYVFAGLTPGAYRVVEILKSGYTQTAAPSPVELSSGEKDLDNDFGNYATADAQGQKWEDRNGNGVHDPGEPGMPGVTIYADSNDNAQLDPGEPFTVTRADDPATPVNEGGTYHLAGLNAGWVEIREVTPTGYVQTFPGQPSFSHRVLLAAGQTVNNLNFGNAPQPGKIEGIKFLDRNGDGVRQPNEPPLAGWPIWLDLNGNGVADPGEPATTTDAAGHYGFTTATGTYIVREGKVNGWTQTAPPGGFHTVTVSAGGSVGGRDFGNRPGAINGTAGDDNIYVVVKPGGQTVDVRQGGADGDVIASFDLKDAPSITISTGGGNDTIAIDFLNGAPVPEGGLSIDGGTGTDLLRLLGTGGPDTLSIGQGYVILNGKRIDRVRIERMRLDGRGGDDQLSIDAALPFSPLFTSLSGHQILQLKAGAYNFPTDPEALSSSLELIASGNSTISLGSAVSLGSLSLVDGARLSLSNGAVFRTSGLAIGDGARVDLGDGSLIVDADPASAAAMLAAITAQIRRARNGSPRWDGNGLTSSAAAANDSTGIAVILNDRGDGTPILSTFRNQIVDASSILVRYTRNGDATMDGRVNADDYFQIDSGFLSRGGDYRHGDFNLDGRVNADDYYLIDFAFLSQGGTGLPAGASPAADPPGQIRGLKWNDVNGDGVRNPGEQAVAGVTIYLDLDNDGTLDPGEPVTTTAADDPATPANETGTYEFPSVPPGTYTVREVVPSGYVQTAPPGGFYTVTVVSGQAVTGINFGNRQTGQLGGTKWDDANGDGVRGDNEAGVPGVTIYIDSNQNGQFDPGEQSTKTLADNPGTPGVNEAGTYRLLNVPPGTVRLREVPPPGTVASFPSTGLYVISLPAGATVNNLDFGNKPGPGEINGTKWSDTDGNGVRDPGEPGLPFVRIYLDLNNNGQLDTTDKSTTTLRDDAATPDVNEAGTYRFTNLAPGVYIVREVVPSGYDQTYPATGAHVVTLTAGKVVTGVDFGNYPKPSEISGTKWNDIDGDGQRDPNEPGLPGVTIYLDLDDDGQRDPGEPVTVTAGDDPQTPANEAGTYHFTGLAPGLYRVREVVPENQTQTYPGNGSYFVELGRGQVAANRDFGNQSTVNPPPPGEISGTKWDDVDGDGVRDPSEPGLPGVTVYLDINHNGQLDNADRVTTTLADDPATTAVDETGTYSFAGLAPGTYTVREVVPAGYEQTYPVGGVHEVVLPSGQVIIGIDFGNQALPGEIHGTKWNDADADRVRDAGEAGIAGVTIYLDLDGDGTWDAGEPLTVTADDDPATAAIDETGTYVFTDVPPGTYSVREVAPDGMAQSYPGPKLMGVSPAGDIFVLNTATGAAPKVASGWANLVDIAVSPIDGRLYGVSKSGEVVIVDANTGAGTLAASTGLTLNEGDIDFDPVTGLLYLMRNAAGALYTVDIDTGASSIVGTLSGTLSDPSAMAFAADGKLFVLDTVGRRLVEIDKASGATLRTVSISGAGSLGGTAGMDFDPLTAKLYVANGETTPGTLPAQLYTLDVLTGALTTIGPTSASISGLEFVPFDAHTVTVSGGQSVAGIDFGNFEAVILPDGRDTIDGGDGDDTIWGDNGSGFAAPIVTIGDADTINGEDGADELHGQDADDILDGGALADLVFGEDGDDIMDGGEGNDILDGALGDDSYVFTLPAASEMDVVRERNSEGTDTINLTQSNQPVTFDLNIASAVRAGFLSISLEASAGVAGAQWMENVLGSLTAANTLTGNAADNQLVGGAADDLFSGGDGLNTLIGAGGGDQFVPGAGSDIVDGNDGYDIIVYNGHAGMVQVDLQLGTGTNVAAFSNVELVIGSAFDDTLIGPEGDNEVELNWRITGPNAGYVGAAGEHDFSSFENLIASNDPDIFAFDPAGSLSGMLDGRGGRDMIDYSAVSTPVSVDLALGTATGTGGITRIEDAAGGSAGDVLRGDAGDNQLIGLGGNDTLIGNAGQDMLRGDAGDDSLEGGQHDDVYVMSEGGGTDALVELAGGGRDLVDYSEMSTSVEVNLGAQTATGISTISEVEFFRGGAGIDMIVGANLPATWQIGPADLVLYNLAAGFAGFENLRGGSDVDTFVFIADGNLAGGVDGQAGDDLLDYSGYGASVVVNLAGFAATGVSGVVGVEQVVGTPGDDVLAGDANANTLVGGDGDDILLGLGGDDQLFGGTGFDLLIGGAGLDLLSGGAGDDILIGGTTSHDGGAAALRSIRLRWSTAAAYLDRVNGLRTNAPVLLPATTVFNDGAADMLTGDAGQDWFFAETAVDSVTDAVAGERVDSFV